MFLFYHLFIYFVFTIHSAMLPKLKSLPLQHYSAPQDFNPSWPVETPVFKRNFEILVCQRQESLRTQARGTRVQALCIQRTGKLVEVGDFKGEIRPADKRTGGSARWKWVGAFLRDSAQNGGGIDWLRKRERLSICLTCADAAKLKY